MMWRARAKLENIMTQNGEGLHIWPQLLTSTVPPFHASTPAAAASFDAHRPCRQHHFPPLFSTNCRRRPLSFFNIIPHLRHLSYLCSPHLLLLSAT
ncbi:hypothetical protein MIMGU_mgv1a017053mg [Erythranthe guttata]|uniref:Uncharacterized protein n=1 Tax=Erythranthe guttata TaxID=4155 RepID=A0A022RA19_ERYGU|nr:hypothetical protein MIMGU_mgv1a017053mg [Erythranthe guttata]